jgi:hypothetical protein
MQCSQDALFRLGIERIDLISHGDGISPCQRGSEFRELPIEP